MNFLRSTSISAKATAQIVASQVKPVVAPVVIADKLPEVPHKPLSLSRSSPVSYTKASCTIGGFSSMRNYHTDLKIPNFDAYRLEKTKDANRKPDEDEVIGRRMFQYLIATGAFAGATYGGKAIVQTSVKYMAAGENILAVSKIEVNLSEIPEGKNVTVKWRGKPLFVRHRTPAEIEREAAVPLTDLRDPQHDHERVQKPEFLIVVGVCTHLGCVPIANAGLYQGYYCPCHGSHYDGSGRIRKGPAPENLEVPAYEFIDENLVSVG